MGRRLFQLLLACILSTSAGPVFAHADGDAPALSGNSEIISTAQTYLAAYFALDAAKLETLTAETMTFSDPTSAAFPAPQGGFNFDSKAAYLAFIKQAGGQLEDFNYQCDRIYEASGRVVCVGTARYIAAAASGKVRYETPVVTIITVAKGLITEHRDYADYSGTRATPIAADRP
ncbi:MAG: nuclear transport factor 2 family protein [Pseudomonadota bacterium]